MELMYNPKCKTLYKRDDNFKVIRSRETLTDPRFALVADDAWVVTEKMDGMSVIIEWDGHGFLLHGRSPNTEFRVEQLEYLIERVNMMEDSLIEHFTDVPVHIYAEFVGPKINGNRHNRSTYGLYVFDIRIGGFWLDWHNVVDICNKVELDTVLRLRDVEGGGLERIYNEIFDLARVGANGYFEGVVVKTDPYVYTAQGDRVMFKLKLSDIAT